MSCVQVAPDYQGCLTVRGALDLLIGDLGREHNLLSRHRPIEAKEDRWLNKRMTRLADRIRAVSRVRVVNRDRAISRDRTPDRIARTSRIRVRRAGRSSRATATVKAIARVRADNKADN